MVLRAGGWLIGLGNGDKEPGLASRFLRTVGGSRAPVVTILKHVVCEWEAFWLSMCCRGGL
jgi:hypothetical protein